MRILDSIVGRRSAALLATVVTLGAATGCSGILDNAVPSRVLEEALEGPSQAALLVSGVQAQFECAWGAATVAVGLITDELIDAQNAQAVIPYDKRDVKPADDLFGVYARSDCVTISPEGLGVYTPLSSARWFADDVTSRLQGWTDQEVANRQVLIATTAGYAGYSLVLLGEIMCSAAIDGGPELDRTALFEAAEDRFDVAVAAAQASGNADLQHFTRLGRARTRLNLGRKADAAADAATIPANFQRLVEWSASAPIRHNRVYAWNNRTFSVSVDPRFRGLTFGGVADPRVPVSNANRNGTDGQTPVWIQGKYTTESAPAQLGSWEEAQLIIAEAAGGQAAVDIINALHLKVGLPPFSSADPAEIQQQVIVERSRELFLESHRLGDVIRYGITLTPAAGTPYPKTGVYGSTTCLPLPDRERDANPNI